MFCYLSNKNFTHKHNLLVDSGKHVQCYMTLCITIAEREREREKHTIIVLKCY